MPQVRTSGVVLVIGEKKVTGEYSLITSLKKIVANGVANFAFGVRSSDYSHALRLK